MRTPIGALVAATPPKMRYNDKINCLITNNSLAKNPSKYLAKYFANISLCVSFLKSFDYFINLRTAQSTRR